MTGSDATLILCDRLDIERASLLGHFREKRSFTSAKLEGYVETGFGLKSRIHPLAAALAQVQLGKLHEVIQARTANYNYLAEKISDVPGIYLPQTHSHVDRGGFFRFILHYRKEELENLPISIYIKALMAEGVLEVKPGNLARPLHFYKMFQSKNNPIQQPSINSDIPSHSFFPRFLTLCMNSKKPRYIGSFS